MRPLLPIALLSLTPVLQAQLEPRDSADEYKQACRFEAGVVGVDYLRRSLPTPQGTQLIPGTLIFELGVYPGAGGTLEFELNHFELDWKKAERAQGPVHPQYVVASLMRPEFSNRHKGLTAEAGAIDGRTGEYAGVRVGGWPRHERFPGDPRQDSPVPETIPLDPRVKKSPPDPDASPSRIISLHALSAEPIDHPSAGYVYFAYNGKLTKLRGLTLNLRQGDKTCSLLIRK